MTNQEKLAEIDLKLQGVPNAHVINGCFCNITEDGPEPFADVPDYSDPGVMLAMLERWRDDPPKDYYRKYSVDSIVGSGTVVHLHEWPKGRNLAIRRSVGASALPTFVEAAASAILKTKQ